ncbi:hypothetical protein H4W81_005058 [Nonomuraea africana]|uniref:Uncharacterized protein n=1 Tax=Nonomuraea africana TaxID=46171 RepID=A0ABR9KJU1_9ACTN|nr:hypothetical protein [Nonomuraea africana]
MLRRKAVMAWTTIQAASGSRTVTRVRPPARKAGTAAA